MPGRLGNSGHASPGPQVLSAQDRPVPAARRNTHLVHKSITDQLASGAVDIDDIYQRGQFNSFNQSPNNPGSKIPAQGYPQEVRRGNDVMSSATYRAQPQPQKPVSTVRPQSAMAIRSPNVHKSGTVDRPPSSLGVAWGTSAGIFDGGSGRQPNVTNGDRMSSVNTQGTQDTRPTTGYGGSQQPSNRVPNGHLTSDDHNDLMFPIHQKSRSFGDGVTVGTAAAHNGYDHVDKAYHKPATRYAGVSHLDYDSNLTNGHRDLLRQDGQPMGRLQPQPMKSPTAYNHILKTPQGRENLAFVHDDNNMGTLATSTNTTNNELRSAWQRLYGSRPEPVSLSREPSVDDTHSRNTPTVDSNARFQTGQNNQASPAYSRANPNTQPPTRRNSNVISTPISNRRPSSGSIGAQQPTSSSQDGGKTDFRYGSTLSLSQQQILPGRVSPTGQSSSNPDPVSGVSSSNQLSSYSTTNRNLSTFKPEKEKPGQQFVDPAIGPAAKYPDTPIQSSRKLSPSNLHGQNLAKPTSRPSSASPLFHGQRLRSNSSNSVDTIEFNVGYNLPHGISRGHNKGSAFLESEDDLGDEYSLQPLDSIFDFPDADSENGSATPRLPDLSPNVTPRGSGRSTPANVSNSRFKHASPVTSGGQRSPPKTPDLLRAGQSLRSAPVARVPDSKGRTQSNSQVKDDKRFLNSRNLDLGGPPGGRHLLTEYTRSRSLEDVRESGNESTISFDIENTMLTVEPSDQSEMGTLRSFKSTSVRAQLNRLEGMYSRVLQTLEETANESKTRRRWSIGSSDTSSLRQPQRHSRHGRSSAHKLGGRDVKAINKRFQRLESHVITLARSVAHLSSEIRTQSTMTREIENVKREINELKQDKHAAAPSSGHATVGSSPHLNDSEKYRYWSPFFANPRRVGKLTRFFGQEPPLLELFLKKLGYEKFLKNFETQHIGMIELPYMTEDRLESIGIPMGPRLRILQEAQICVRKGDFDIYFV
ncbi:unnamed protein product [Lymnaea stagnalis]|uniref:SAM domain-containing protein n=1 Tax=Lymnaea stagnalis TaxID=6523 RepID=A0AAV2H4R7_LYMST